MYITLLADSEEYVGCTSPEVLTPAKEKKKERKPSSLLALGGKPQYFRTGSWCLSSP